MISIGLLGCGRIGQVHARSLARIASANLVAVADFVPAAAEELAGQYGAEVWARQASPCLQSRCTERRAREAEHRSSRRGSGPSL